MTIHTIFGRWRGPCVAAFAATAALVGAGSASANVPLTPVSADPFTNASSQHATEVEPDTFASGSTVLATYQVGRFFNGGASDIGYARSTDGGVTWGTSSFLPGLTFNAGPFGDPSSPFERVSDPSVAFDARHNTWMISSIPILPASLVVPTIFVSRSTDGGVTFGNPVQIPPPAKKVNLDKNWTVCDNHAGSPFYGNCYTEFDNFGEGDLEYMSTSSDGGLTWSTPVSPAGNPKGLGGQPVVQPNGTVIVPFESLKGTIGAFRSDRRRRNVVQGGRRLEDQLPPELRRPEDEPPAHSRDRCGGQRIRGVGGLPLRAQVHGQRHRVQHVERRRELERCPADPDRSGR